MTEGCDSGGVMWQRGGKLHSLNKDLGRASTFFTALLASRAHFCLFSGDFERPSICSMVVRGVSSSKDEHRQLFCSSLWYTLRQAQK